MSDAGRQSEAARTERAPPLYLSFMLELERRRLELGIGQERLGEVAGLADRAFAKALWPDTATGRMARWQTLQHIADVLFADGFQLRIEPKNGPTLNTIRLKYQLGAAKATYDRKAQREHMARIGQLGGRARAARLKPGRRRAIARRAARARWKGGG